MMIATAASFHSAAVPPTPSHSTVAPSVFCAASCASSSCFSSVHFSSRNQLRPVLSCSVSCVQNQFRKNLNSKGLLIRCSAGEPLKVMICGAPASGKGTQCEMIVNKYGLIHVSTGDLLRAEVSAGSEIGLKAKDYMNSGRLVPDEIVTTMVINRLSQEDALEKGWLLDGYPRTASQAESLEQLNCRPNAYIVLDVLDDALVERCVGRRLDPVTGKIYHIKNFPPETEEIKARLIIRGDDTEEKVKSRLEIYKNNVEATISFYSKIMIRVDGNRSKTEIFDDIDSFLSQAHELSISRTSKTSNTTLSTKGKWKGVPTRLNNIPHSREIRKYFYDDVLQATQRAVSDGRTRLKIEINIPELNPEMDVYRIGTLMELVRALALAYADDGKRVKVCVQGSMGEGALAGMPLQLAGTRKILEFMDWGDYGAKGDFIRLASIGGSQVDEEDDMFFLIAPQNAVGNCIIDDLKAMTDAAGSRPVVLINPRLKDLPGSSGIMQTMGREKRLEYAASFESCYAFRLLYYAGTQYPIMGALRMSFPYEYELYKRVDQPSGKEEYVKLCTFSGKPTSDDINNAFLGRSKEDAKKMSGFWGIVNSLLN